MRKFVLVIALACGLAACDPASDDTYGIACAGISVADVGFQLYASTGKVDQATINAERLAVAGAQAICDGPRPTNVITSLAAVRRALTAIASTTAKARSQAGA